MLNTPRRTLARDSISRFRLRGRFERSGHAHKLRVLRFGAQLFADVKGDFRHHFFPPEKAGDGRKAHLRRFGELLAPLEFPLLFELIPPLQGLPSSAAERLR